MTPRQKKILQIISIPLFYVCALFVFVRLTFPYDTLRDRLLAEYNGGQSERRLEIERLSGSGLLGVEAEGVRLIEASKPQSGDEELPTSPAQLVVDNVSVGVSALSYLFGATVVDFDAEVGGGELSGSFRQDPEGAQIVVEGEEVDISEMTMLSAGLGLPLGGSWSGAADLFLPTGQMNKAEGSIDFLIKALTVGDGKAKVRDTIALPKLNAGDLVFKAQVTEGRMEVSEFATDGADFKLDAQGKVRLREPFDKSSLNLDASFDFKEAYRSRNDLTKSLFGSKDSKVPALFDMDPLVRRAKQADGSYAWQVTGLLSKPNFRPSRKRKPSTAK